MPSRQTAQLSVTALDRCLSVSGSPQAVELCRAAICDPELDWLDLAARANQHYVGASVWTTLTRYGLDGCPPEDVRLYLQLLHDSNAARNAKLRDQCVAVGHTLAAKKLDAVLLKGAAWLFDGSAAPAADRMMRDIDLLVAPDRLESATAALVAAGYRDSSASFVEIGHFHHAPLIPPEGLACVELHRDLAHRADLLSPAEVLASAKPVAPGLLLPSYEHRIVHNVVHAQIENGDWAGGVVNLRDSLDLARLVVAADDVDWPRLASAARRRGFRPALSGAIHAAHRALQSPLPAALAADRSGRLHAWRCAQQRRWPLLTRIGEGLGPLTRALSWERDAYALGLKNRLSWRAQWLVNGRRLRRIREALRRGDHRRTPEADA